MSGAWPKGLSNIRLTESRGDVVAPALQLAKRFLERHQQLLGRTLELTIVAAQRDELLLPRNGFLRLPQMLLGLIEIFLAIAHASPTRVCTAKFVVHPQLRRRRMATGSAQCGAALQMNLLREGKRTRLPSEPGRNVVRRAAASGC